MNREEIAKILRRNRGSIVGLARELKVNVVGLNNWLRGTFTSARIHEAATRKAEQLLRIETFKAELQQEQPQPQTAA